MTWKKHLESNVETTDLGPVAKRIFNYIKRRPKRGATTDEVEGALGLLHQTASARINEMRDWGLLRETGIRRPTRTGRPANVYAVAI